MVPCCCSVLFDGVESDSNPFPTCAESRSETVVSSRSTASFEAFPGARAVGKVQVGRHQGGIPALNVERRARRNGGRGPLAFLLEQSMAAKA